MDKRARLKTKQLLYTFYILFAIIVLVLFTSHINQLANSKGVNQDFLSRDLGLIIDTLYNSPNPIEFTYFNPDNYQLRINDNSISVNKPGEAAIRKYPYTKDNNFQEFNVNINVKKDSSLVFDKNKNIVVSSSG